MKRRNILFILTLFILAIVASPILTDSETALAKSTLKTVSVIDDADILTPEEEQEITSELTSLQKKHDVMAIVYTLNTPLNDIDKYIYDFWENQKLDNDCVILAINMDPGNRQIHVQGYGKAERYIGNKRAQSITDNMVSDCKNGDYYNAVHYFITKADYDLSHKIEVLLPQFGLILLGSMVFAGIIVLVMVHNAGGKDTTNVNTYLDFSSSKLLAKRDIYTHTTTTRHKRESPSSSGGGGGSHSSGTSSF